MNKYFIYNKQSEQVKYFCDGVPILDEGKMGFIKKEISKKDWDKVEEKSLEGGYKKKGLTKLLNNIKL